MYDVTIFHNPACSMSRNTLALLRHAGLEPTVVEYLQTPPDDAMLRTLVDAMGTGVRSLLRDKETLHAELQLEAAHWSDDELIGFMQQHPILINRPVVVTPLGTRLCRPVEAVLDVLPVPMPLPFTKENGEVVIDPGLRTSDAHAAAPPAASA